MLGKAVYILILLQSLHV